MIQTDSTEINMSAGSPDEESEGYVPSPTPTPEPIKEVEKLDMNDDVSVGYIRKDLEWNYLTTQPINSVTAKHKNNTGINVFSPVNLTIQV